MDSINSTQDIKAYKDGIYLEELILHYSTKKIKT
jgi:hypothetical protein